MDPQHGRVTMATGVDERVGIVDALIELETEKGYFRIACEIQIT